MDAAAELGRNPVSNHQIQPEYRDEQADAGRDRLTRIARPNSQARTTRTGKYYFSVDLENTSTEIYHPGSSEVPRNPLTRWDVSSIPANGIFLTKKLKNKNKNAQRVEND